MSKRRKKREYPVSKRCSCADRNTCPHPWLLRVRANGHRQRVNLTALYPGEPVKVAAAKAKEDARKGLLVNGARTSVRTDARPTVGDVGDHYLQARGTKKHYYLSAFRASRTVSGATMEHVAADDVTKADIMQAVAAWRARPRAKSGAKGGAVAERHFLQTVRHLFNWAIEEGYATRTPFKSPQGVNLIHVKASKGRSRRLESGEEERILAVAEPQVADFFTAMIETGCRPGELRTLQWSEVGDQQLVVLEAKSKTRKLRKIPIMPRLRTILDRRRKGPDGNELPSSAYVFGNETGELMTRRRLCGLWLDTCDKAKVSDLHLHDLRAEAGSQLLEAGVALHDVRDALGHSSTTMTNAYLRTRVDNLTKAYQQREVRRARQSMKAL